MGLKPSQIDLQIERIDVAAMPAGGERRLREAITRELARLANGTGDRSPRPERRGGRDGAAKSTIEEQLASQVHAEVARKVKA
jgi:hypothetical protein